MSENRTSQTREPSSYNYKDRRRKNDWVIHMATILTLISWLIAFAVWVVLDLAKPESEHLLTLYFDIEVRKFWNTSLLPIAFGLLILSLCFCIFAFVFNMLRMRRKTDKYRKSIIVIGLITIVGIVFFLIRFSGVIFA